MDAFAEVRGEFWQDVNVPGQRGADLNQSLERAGRVADFFELAELMCIDALHRNESCGGHFREEYQTPEGEALRDDEHFSYVAAWEYRGGGNAPELHKEAARVPIRTSQPEELQIAMRLILKIWRQKNSGTKGQVCSLRSERREPRHVDARMPRRSE